MRHILRVSPARLSYTDLKIVATETERHRTTLLLNVDSSTNVLSREQRILELQRLSKYHVPLDWQIPIEVVDVDLDKSAYPSDSSTEPCKSNSDSVFNVD
jgi:hypothetical protein